jgi:hypothetical protein
MSKITNGTNDGARDEIIAQRGPGIPDDSNTPVEASDKEIGEARRKLRKGNDASDSIQLERQL